VVVLTCLASILSCLRSGTEALNQKFTPPLQYIGAWGVKGDGPGQLDDPASIATDAFGNVWIADAGSRFIHKFSPEGEALLSFQENALHHPQWITLDSGGAIYVSDPVRNSVFVFLPNGDRYRELRLRTHPASGNELTVAVDDDGAIYALDADAGKVFHYTRRFRLVQSWMPVTSLHGRRGDLGAIEAGRDGYLYIADTHSNCIVRVTGDGHLISRITGGADESGPKIAGEFAISKNYIIMIDADRPMLHVWTTGGTPKLDFDLTPELGQRSRPVHPVAVSPRGELLVLDAPGARVLRYRINF
jgi:hypothetical protein